jgi:hypothetical protein
MHLNFLTGEMFNSKQGVTTGHHGQSVYRGPSEARGRNFQPANLIVAIDEVGNYGIR